MEHSEIPQLSEECKQELTKALLEFLEKRVSADAIANIEFDIKFKLEDNKSISLMRATCVLGASGPSDPCYIIQPKGSYRAQFS